MVEQATQALGPIDILVNSAAVFDDKLFLESGPEDWRRMIEVCLYGAMNVIHAVLPGMVERRHGRIIALASDAARIRPARLSYYAAAKGGVVRSEEYTSELQSLMRISFAVFCLSKLGSDLVQILVML